MRCRAPQHAIPCVATETNRRYSGRVSPTVTITSGPASPTTDTSATFTYSADEPSTFTCSINSAPYASCAASGVTYSALPYGLNNFGVKATDLAGNVGTPAKASWYVSRTSGTTVSDTGFSTVSRLAMGTTMTWTNIGAAQHTVTDKRLGLFDSGPLDPGGTFAVFFNGASTYTVMSTLDAFPTQQIPVRPTVSPSSGHNRRSPTSMATAKPT